MVVRKVTSEDAEKICLLANSIRLDNTEPQKEGFLVYVLDEEQYRSRTISSFFYVAETDLNFDGFLMCYDYEILKKLAQRGLIGHEDKVIEFIIGQQEPYIFGDQIGVDVGKNNQGIGKALIEQLFQDMKAIDISTIYVAILHKPIRNEASISFCRVFGFEQIAEVTNRDETTWGIYQAGIGLS